MPATEIAHSIDLNLPEKLRDREYRQRFFLAESSAQIASQLIALRKRRGLNQQQVAELVETKQPAISRIEKADYQSWSFSFLRKIAGALDARIRVLIEPSEDVLEEYEDQSSVEAVSENEAELQSANLAFLHHYQAALSDGTRYFLNAQNIFNNRFSRLQGAWVDSFALQPGGISAFANAARLRAERKDRRIAELEGEVAWLRRQLEAREKSTKSGLLPIVPTSQQIQPGL